MLAMATLLCATYRRLNRRAPNGRHALYADDRTTASRDANDLVIAEQVWQELEQCAALRSALEKTSNLAAVAGQRAPQTKVKVLGIHLADHGQTSQAAKGTAEARLRERTARIGNLPFPAHE